MMRLIFSHLLFIIFLILLGIVYFLTLTDAGLAFEAHWIENLFLQKLTIGRTSGKLLTKFSLQNITYQTDQQYIHINQLTLAWNPLGLLFKQILIDQLTLDHASLILQRTTKQDNHLHHTWKFSDWPAIKLHKIFLQDINIQYADASLKMNGRVDKQWHLQWQTQIPHLALFDPQLSGSLQSQGQLTGTLNAPLLQTNFLADNVKWGEQDLKNLTLTTEGHFAQTKTALNATFSMLFNQTYRINGTLSLPHFFHGLDISQPVQAKFDTTLTQLNFLTYYLPVIQNPQGTLQASLLIQGALAHPTLSGALNLINGRCSVPVLGITPEKINLTSQVHFPNAMHFSGQLISGTGQANLQGMVDLASYTTQLQVRGNYLQAIQLPEYNIVISPDVHLTFTQQNIAINGNILIPFANIAPKELKSSVELPSEVVFVNHKTTSTPLPFTTSLQLHLTLGDHIHVAHNNLNAELGGSVQLLQQPNALINASGELYAHGTYKAYGQTLKIQNGRLIYTGGSLMNPGLNIAAVKQIKAVNVGGNLSSFSGTTKLAPVYTGTHMVTVGVQVSGTLDRPTINLFSTPAMAQADILSYLAVGTPQSQASGSQYGALLSILSSFSPHSSGIENLTQKMQRSLGVNEINIQATQVFDPSTHSAVSTTAFVVGKQLAPNLYLHYSVGLFYPVSILNLRYQFSPKWAIQSETSTIDNGADLLYTFERD